jgi:hypothetical protein
MVTHERCATNSKSYDFPLLKLWTSILTQAQKGEAPLNWNSTHKKNKQKYSKALHNKIAPNQL